MTPAVLKPLPSLAPPFIASPARGGSHRPQPTPPPTPRGATEAATLAISPATQTEATTVVSPPSPMLFGIIALASALVLAGAVRHALGRSPERLLKEVANLPPQQHAAAATLLVKAATKARTPEQGVLVQQSLEAYLKHFSAPQHPVPETLRAPLEALLDTGLAKKTALLSPQQQRQLLAPEHPHNVAHKVYMAQRKTPSFEADALPYLRLLSHEALYETPLSTTVLRKRVGTWLTTLKLSEGESQAQHFAAKPEWLAFEKEAYTLLEGLNPVVGEKGAKPLPVLSDTEANQQHLALMDKLRQLVGT